MPEDMDISEKLSPLYEQLKGILAELLSPEIGPYATVSENICNDYNELVSEIEQLTGQDLAKFKATDIRDFTTSGRGMYLNIFRIRLQRLIRKLNAEHFEEEIDEAGRATDSGRVYISQHQSQEQSVHLEVALRMQEQIIKALTDKGLKDNEKNFLEEIKTTLSATKSVLDLVPKILELASKWGIAVQFLAKIFGASN